MTEEIEEKIPFASWDHKQFYLEGKAFTPVVYEGRGEPPSGFNSVLIYLSARLEDDLDWKKELLRAEELSKKGYYLLWQIDFGLPAIVWEDEPSFLTLKIAAGEFRKIFSRFENVSLGALLYSGSVDLREHFLWTEKQLENWEKWQGLANFPDDQEQAKRLFCLDVLVHYFSVLAPHLPDELPLMLAFDGSGVPSYEFLELLSKERFEHLILAVKGNIAPYAALSWQKGVSSFGYLGEENFSPDTREAKVGVLFTAGMESILKELTARRIAFRVLYEDFAAMEWDGLDSIIFLGKMTSKVKRILQGFSAAGGAIVSDEGSMEGSISWEAFLEENRGRGI